MTEALSPCPFCGHSADIGGDDDSGYFALCMRPPGGPDGLQPEPQCYAAMGENYDRSAMPEHQYPTRGEAIAAWNRRASRPLTDTSGPTDFCVECLNRAQAEVDAGHYYAADEVFAAIDEGRESVCHCGQTHPDGVWRILPAAPVSEPSADAPLSYWEKYPNCIHCGKGRPEHSPGFQRCPSPDGVFDNGLVFTRPSPAAPDLSTVPDGDKWVCANGHASRWNIKSEARGGNVCPACHGWVRLYTLAFPEPSADAPAELCDRCGLRRDEHSQTDGRRWCDAAHTIPFANATHPAGAQAELQAFSDALARKGRAVEAARLSLEQRVREAVDEYGYTVPVDPFIERLRTAIDECDRVRATKAWPAAPVPATERETSDNE